MNDVSLKELMQNKNTETAVQTTELTTDLAETQITFTPEEQKEIANIRKNINLMNTNDVLAYGNGAQRNLSNFADNILSSVKVKDSGEVVSDLLTNLSMNIRKMEEGKGKAFLRKIPLVGSLVGGGEKILAKYDTVSKEVDNIVIGLENSRTALMKDIAVLDGLYKENLAYFKKLNLYIEAGEQELKVVQEETLPRLRQEAAQSNDQMALQAVADYEGRVERFEKRLHDLKISRTVSIQTAPQLRLMQNSNRLLVEKIYSAINNSIPVWKNAIVISISMGRQQKALATYKATTDMTNELLRKNAEMLKINSIETAKANERSIVDIDTIKKVNEELITTIEETLRIQRDGRAQRQAAEQELQQIEGRLKNTLLGTMQNR